MKLLLATHGVLVSLVPLSIGPSNLGSSIVSIRGINRKQPLGKFIIWQLNINLKPRKKSYLDSSFPETHKTYSFPHDCKYFEGRTKIKQVFRKLKRDPEILEIFIWLEYEGQLTSEYHELMASESHEHQSNQLIVKPDRVNTSWEKSQVQGVWRDKQAEMSLKGIFLVYIHKNCLSEIYLVLTLEMFWFCCLPIKLWLTTTCYCATLARWSPGGILFILQRPFIWGNILSMVVISIARIAPHQSQFNAYAMRHSLWTPAWNCHC